MHFLHLNFLNVQGILAQSMYNVCVFFVNFPTLKVGENHSSQASSVSWLPVSPSAPALAVLTQCALGYHHPTLPCQATF